MKSEKKERFGKGRKTSQGERKESRAAHRRVSIKRKTTLVNRESVSSPMANGGGIVGKRRSKKGKKKKIKFELTKKVKD